jgi:hypothetical protein
MKDLMEPRFLIEQATAKMKQRFPRPFKQRQVWPRVYLAVERLLASGCLRSFSVASDYSSCAYSLVIDRKDVLDIKNIDE